MGMIALIVASPANYAAPSPGFAASSYTGTPSPHSAYSPMTPGTVAYTPGTPGLGKVSCPFFSVCFSLLKNSY